jgi:hypothetical protein
MPAAVIVAAVASKASCCLPFNTSLAPCFPNSKASALPIPLLDPVMMTTFPANADPVDLDVFMGQYLKDEKKELLMPAKLP